MVKSSQALKSQTHKLLYHSIPLKTPQLGLDPEAAFTRLFQVKLLLFSSNYPLTQTL